MINKRPLLLYLMLLALALLSTVNGLQWVQALKSAAWLKAFGYFPSPIYAVFEGFFFMILFIACLVALWSRQAFAPALGGISIALYLAWSWIDRLVVTSNPAPISSQLLAMGISLAMVLLAEFSFFLLVPFMRRTVLAQHKEENNGRSS